MFFPMFVDISKKKILVVGGGNIAFRRVKTLLKFEPEIHVVAKEITKDLMEVTVLHLEKRAFKESDIEGFDIVCAATDDEAVNHRIYEICREKKILVNVSSDRKLCDFYFPSVVVEEEIVIGINASGKNHKRVKETRMLIERLFQK